MNPPEKCPDCGNEYPIYKCEHCGCEWNAPDLPVWHNAKTDPPKEDGEQLVYWGDNAYGWMRYDSEHGWCSEIDPVYWMPLPEPPKEDK